MSTASNRAAALWRDHFLLQGIVALWGLTAVLGKLITMAPMPLVVWRTGLSALALAALAWGRGDVSRLTARQLAATMGNGCLIGLHWYLFFLAGRLGNVSTSLAGVATAPLWVALLEPLLIKGRRLVWRECLLSVAVIGGVVMLAGNPEVNLPCLLTGSMAAGVAALFTIINARLVRHIPAQPMTCVELAAASAFTALLSGWVEPLTTATAMPSGWTWLWISLLALVCTAFAFTACVSLQQRVPAFTIGLAGNLEPVYGMILARLVFGASEVMGPGFYAGSAVIIGCVLLHGLLPWLGERSGKKLSP